MNNDEDSVWAWTMVVVLGLCIAAGFILWPVFAWWIVWKMFK